MRHHGPLWIRSRKGVRFPESLRRVCSLPCMRQNFLNDACFFVSQTSGLLVMRFRMENASRLDAPELLSYQVDHAFTPSLLEKWALNKVGACE